MPQGGAINAGNEVELNPEELEALRLKDVEGLDQTAAAKRMGISQSSFQRILDSVRKKLSAAIFEGRVIRIKQY